nr:hypothetical protein [Tanacetum cinerariifolium]
MTLTFVDTHNMVAYLNKSDASKGFNQIIDFLNGSYIAYALTFWNTITVKQSNDVTRIQALVDKKKVVVTEATIRNALHLDDAEGVDCLPNEEIFTTLARMGYKKPSTKLTFYKAFFSSHTFNFSKYIFESLVKNVDSSSKFYMYPREPENQGDAEEQGNDNNAAEEPVTAVNDVANQSIQSPTPLNPPPQQPQDIPSTLQVEGRQADIYHIDMDHATKVLSMQEDEPEIQEAVKVVTTAKLITEVVAAVSETVSAAAVVQADVPAASVNVAVVVTTAALVKVTVLSTRRRRRVVFRDPEEESSAKTPTETKSKDKGKGIMEVAMDHVKQKAKENPYVQRYQVTKKRPQTEAQARRNMMVCLKNTARFTLDYFKGMSYDDIRPIFEAKFNANMEFLLKYKEHMEEEKSIAIAIINKTPAQKAAKRRRLNKETEDVEELKQHLEIVPDEDDDVYTEATPLARKLLLSNSAAEKNDAAKSSKDLQSSSAVASLYLNRRNLSSLVVGKSSGSGNSSLAVGMP